VRVEQGLSCTEEAHLSSSRGLCFYAQIFRHSPVLRFHRRQDIVYSLPLLILSVETTHQLPHHSSSSPMHLRFLFSSFTFLLGQPETEESHSELFYKGCSTKMLISVEEGRTKLLDQKRDFSFWTLSTNGRPYKVGHFIIIY
jgi:hypothetical protein